MDIIIRNVRGLNGKERYAAEELVGYPCARTRHLSSEW
jgi:hypothetical protein